MVVQDARGDGQYLRATWHPNGRLFVLSHWQDDVFGAPATSPAPPGQEAEPFEATVIPWAVPGDRPQAVSGAGGGQVGR